MMRNLFRSSGLVLLAVFLTALACVWVLSMQYVDNQKDSDSSSAQQYVGLARETAHNFSEQYAERLTRLIEKQFFMSEQELNQSVHFEGVALATQSVEGWKVVWSKFKDEALMSEDLQAQFVKWPLEGVQPSEIRWTQFRLQNGRVLHAIIINIQSGSSEPQRGIGLLPLTAFADLVTGFKVKDDKLFLVDGAGNAYAYPEPQYVGTKFDSHTLVQHLVRNASVSYSGVFKTFGGEPVTGAYARVPDSNLYAAYTTPYYTQPQILKRFYVQVGLVAFGLALLLAAIAHAVRSRELHVQEVLTKNLQLERARTKEEQVETTVVVKQETSQFSRSLVKIMERPVLAGIGFLQMLSSEIKTSTGKERLQKLERELRFLKNLIADMGKPNSSKSEDLTLVSIDEVVEQVLASVRKECTQKKIGLEENINAQLFTKASHEDVKEGLRTIVHFLIGKIEPTSSEKKITLNLEKAGSMARIVCEAKGIKIGREEAKNIFKISTMEQGGAAASGLAMLLAKSNAEYFQGGLSFEVIGTDGGRFILSYPKVENLNSTKAANETKEEISSILSEKTVTKEMALDLPPPPKDMPLNVTVKPEVHFEKAQPPVVPAKVSKEESTQTVSGVVIRKPKIRTDS